MKTYYMGWGSKIESKNLKKNIYTPAAARLS